MLIKFGESNKGKWPMKEPILSLMMWGRLTDYNIKTTIEERKFDTWEDRRVGAHVCFSEKLYWMLTHSEKGSLTNLEGPVMTQDMKMIYPCSKPSY